MFRVSEVEYITVFVIKSLNIYAVLKEEMEGVMKLIGIKNLSEVHPSLVNTSDIDHLVPDGADHPYVKWSPQPRL